jgi:hypothetical protein
VTSSRNTKQNGWPTGSTNTRKPVSSLGGNPARTECYDSTLGVVDIVDADVEVQLL